MNRKLNLVLSIVALIFSILSGESLIAQCRSKATREPTEQLPDDLTQVDLRKLLSFEIEVTSPSKKPQKLSDVAAAVFVLTGEEIKRLGVNHVADALRMVPGLNVAQVSENQWAISSRGNNNTFARHLLVLLDGQSIFSPMFNGVFWDQYELDLLDIDRIEIIRGPGASIWGSNAVNGVINIITCSAQDTSGSRVEIGGGNSERLVASARTSRKLSDSTSYRVSTRFVDRDDNDLERGGSAEDGYDIISSNFRLDSQLNKRDALSFSGYGFYAEKDLQVTVPSFDPPYTDEDSNSGNKDLYGVNLVSKWSRQVSEKESVLTQLDYAFERQSGLIFPLYRHTLHSEAQHRLELLDGHDVSYGVGYRFHQDKLYGNFADSLDPARRTTHLFTAFVNDEIAIVPDVLSLILGFKIEHNTHTDFEHMPNARMSYKAAENVQLWASVARAVANPSRVFDDIVYPVAAFPDPDTGIIVLPTLFGDDEVDSENLMAYESGLRVDISDNASVDLSVFYNDYGDYQTLEPGESYVGMIDGQSQPALIIPLTFDNGFELDTYGTELALSWTPSEVLRLLATYSFLKIDVSTGNSLDVPNISFYGGSSPQHQASFRAFYDISEDLQLDTMFRYVDRLSHSDVDAYFDVDLRIGWELSDGVEFEVVGANLLEDGRKEFLGEVIPAPAVEISRSVFGRVRVAF